MKKCIFILLLTLFGCVSKPSNANITIGLTDNNRTLTIKGIGNDIAQEIANDSSNNIWQSLIPVYRMPADTDMKDFQKAQPGKYVVKTNAIIFIPDTPFVKQAAYFVRYYQYNTNNSALDYIRHRAKLGKTPYTDLIFKPQ